ncbi:MAG: peptide chain release factor 1 [Alphaproteobacteria bacterium]|nr:peptide chain release factor 1 [Alphaproteobacteria bacterium]
MITAEKLNAVRTRFETLQTSLASAALPREEYVRAARELSELTPIVSQINLLQRYQKEIATLDAILSDNTEDPEVKSLAEGEIRDLKARLPETERKLWLMLLPQDEADEKNAILEVRAGTGGDEAALFAYDLFRMYQRYAESKGWKFEIMEMSATDLHGMRDAVASISGRGVFARLKFESGVHRVQRVPVTEGSGRIHTSAATVAVLPEAEEVDIKIDEKDLRIDVFRSRGPGGQSVNTTDSAVRITHLPTGIVVSQQDEKSQHKNKSKAMKIMRARLYERERQLLDQERAAMRKSQVGSGDRSERVRTYNFPQNRVTDHRVNVTVHDIEKFLAGEALDQIIEPLLTDDQAQRLASLNAVG